MAMQHKEYPVIGLQFHPESIYTEHGKRMVENFINGINQEVVMILDVIVEDKKKRLPEHKKNISEIKMPDKNRVFCLYTSLPVHAFLFH